MAICEITGKGKMYGHNVSFSQHKTRKIFKPNIQKKTLTIDGKKIRLNVSTAAMRTLKKKDFSNNFLSLTRKISSLKNRLFQSIF